MTLTLLFALMTAAAIFAVLWPLSRRNTKPGGSDLAVYRDQLNEIDRDRAAGLIAAPEAEAAKVEVSRRLIAAADAAAVEKSKPDISPLRRRRVTAIAALVLLPVGAVALYLMLGSPQMPGEPLAARMRAPERNRSIESMIAQVEDRLQKNPTDGRAWEVLAPVYMRLGRFDEAVRAWGHVINLNGSTAAREANYGEAMVAAANGVVTADAKSAFERALKLDPKDVMARFYMGMAADQDGRRADAERIWNDLLADAPPGAPWIEAVRSALAQKPPAGVPPAANALGPTPDDAANVAKLPPEQQTEMIRGMVARLADKLKQDGSDVEGWQRLLRAYLVLGERAKAQAAASDARRALAGDSNKLRSLNEAIKNLGLQG
jgi:cytochrome c-type biogenesis protein CcmH